MAEKEEVTFQRRKPQQARPKNLRTQLAKLNGGSSSDEDTGIDSQLTDIREVQKTRQRRGGMNAVECAVGKELAREFSQLDEDPFRMRGGGMLRLSDDRKAALTAADIEHSIKDQFKKETLLRDENEEMRKYIDSKLKAERKTEGETVPETLPEKRAKLSNSNPDEMILFRAAEKVRGHASKPSAELLSNQMLIGIPEVDLGIDARISNIVETERKKAELLNKSKRMNP